MEQKKINITIFNEGCYSQHKLFLCHEGEAIIDNKVFKADIVDETLKEWYVDNTTHYSFRSLEDAKTFRGYIANSNKIFCLLGEKSKDKIFIILTNDDGWWELLLKNKELYCKRVKTQSNDFDSIFKVFYSLKYFKWIELNLSEEMSVTKKMKIVAEHLK